MKLPGRRGRATKASSIKRASAGRSTTVKAVGALALIGGLVAVLARRLKGGVEPDPFARSTYEPAGEQATTVGGPAPPVAVAPDPVDESGTEPEHDAPADEPEEPEEPEHDAPADEPEEPEEPEHDAPADEPEVPPFAEEPEAAEPEAAPEEPAAADDEPRRGQPFPGIS